jgi:hypothetical protein
VTDYAFTLTYIDAAGRHHAQPAAVRAKSPAAAWKRVAADATAKGAAPAGRTLIFVRLEETP